MSFRVPKIKICKFQLDRKSEDHWFFSRKTLTLNWHWHAQPLRRYTKLIIATTENSEKNCHDFFAIPGRLSYYRVKNMVSCRKQASVRWAGDCGPKTTKLMMHIDFVIYPKDPFSITLDNSLIISPRCLVRKYWHLSTLILHPKELKRSPIY